MSPATNTPGTLVCQAASVVMVPRGLRSIPSCSNTGDGSVPPKPIASSTRSAGSSRSEPAISFTVKLGPSSTSTTLTARSAPSSVPRNSCTAEPKIRVPPSSCADAVRRITGQVGHGLRAESRIPGGSGMTSIRCTEAAPWRCAVPRQSAAVSPPPSTITCLPSALIGGASRVPLTTRFEPSR